VQYGGVKELATLPHLTRGLVRLAMVWGMLCIGMCACRYMCVCVCVCMRIWCRHCMGIQPAFGLITLHTYTEVIESHFKTLSQRINDCYSMEVWKENTS